MASINGRLVNGNHPAVKKQRAEIEARIAYQRRLAEESATPLGQTASWSNHGDSRQSTNRNEKF